MGLKSNYQKFKKHLKSGGLFYAFFRGVKYFIFLINRQINRQRYKPKQLFKDIITSGKLKIACSNHGINIFWNNSEITKGIGLNVGIDTLGLWTDSSKADWQILEKGPLYFKARIVFRELPLSQIWTIRIEKDIQIYWQMDMEIEEALYIDEFRILCMTNPRYKNWINNYHQENFPRLDNRWRNLCLESFSTSLVGVRLATEGKLLPSVTLEPQNNKNLFPIIQNLPLNINAHIIGFRKIDSEDKRGYFPGQHHLFSGRINLFEKDYMLDDKIESLRRDYLETIMKEKTKNRKSQKKLKVLLVNLPWEKEGRQGVRAGSRWPHTKDLSEGKYLPFPFFLAYATSILRENNIEADLVDAIAEEIPDDKFIEDLSRRDFDILVTETSVPSFYYDMGLLKRLPSLNFPVVLCGPHSEIYKREFLEENKFIDFVLFGEYEFTLLELIKAISEGRKNLSSIKGLIWRDDNNNVIKNLHREPFDINLLPWPYREGLAMEKYWDLPGNIPYPSVQMVASRGCPFGCNFCLWPQVLFGGRTYRVRNIKDCIGEMEFLVREKGFKSVYFDDDTFNIGKERTLKFCKAIKDRGLENIPWAILARADLMDEEVLTEMKSAGLWAVKYGVESFNQSLIENCHKNMDLEKNTKMIKLTKSLGIKTHLTFCFGFLGETKDTIKKTIDYALSLEPDSVQFSILTPFPGTRLFEELERDGKILTKDWSLYDGHYSCVFQPDNLSPSDLEEAKRYAYRVWVDYQRKKRGLKGDIKRFFDYWQNYGLDEAFRRTTRYFSYLLRSRKRFMGRI